MPIIQADGLSKTYRVFQKKDGLLGAVRGLYKRDYKEVKAVGGVSFSIEPGEMVAFPRPQWCGQDHHTQDALRPDLPHVGLGRGSRVRPLEAGRFLPPSVRPGDGPEESALVGPPGRRQLPAPPRDLLAPEGRIRKDTRRADRTAGGREADPPGGPRAFPWRTDEDGADRRPAPPTQAPAPGTSRPSASTWWPRSRSRNA